VEWLIDFFAYLVLVAILLVLVDRLNLGLSVSGFGVAVMVAAVVAAFGLLYSLVTLGQHPGGLVSGLVNWVVAAFLLWLAGRFVSGFTVKNMVAAIVSALVMAVMYVGVVAIAKMFFG
jgi:uncharacterized membrane protein YvlD (DUF360 family)